MSDVVRVEVEKYSILETSLHMKANGSRMVRQRYQPNTMVQYLMEIQPAELGQKYLDFYYKFPFYNEVCAGAKHHHYWSGGLLQHVLEMIGMGLDIMQLYPGDFNSFTKDDLVIVCFLHDFAKVWQYRRITDEDRIKNPKLLPAQVFTYTDGQFNYFNHETKTLLELARFGIVPTDLQWSSVVFAEGGFAQAHYDFGGISEQSAKIMKVNPLSVFVSMLDAYSSQMISGSLI